jgi:hypothetical protein
MTSLVDNLFVVVSFEDIKRVFEMFEKLSYDPEIPKSIDLWCSL